MNADRVVVIGAGFAAAAAIEFLTAAGVDVEVVDPRGYLLFTPLLYRVALGDLDPHHVAIPIARLRRGRGRLIVSRLRVESIDVARRTLRCSGRKVPFERLVIATGGTPAGHGIRNADGEGNGDRPFALWGLSETMSLREQLAVAASSGSRVVVVGAGPTGVEIAGPLAQRGAEVTLVDGATSPLPAMSSVSRRFAAAELRRVGVQLELGSPVVAAGAEYVRLEDGRSLEAAVVVWAAGLEGQAPPGSPDVQDGRIACRADLSVGPAWIYAAGDVAVPPGRPLPMLASVAGQQGHHAARSLLAATAGRPTRPFRFVDHGRLAYVTDRTAVADIGGFTLTGLPAWMVSDAGHRLLTRYPTAGASPIPFLFSGDGRPPRSSVRSGSTQ